MTRTVLAIVLIGLVAGCAGPSSSVTPAAPSTNTQGPSPPAQPALQRGFIYQTGYTLIDVTLSGIVYELTADGPIPVAGVEVYCDACGATGHTSSNTDTEGMYRFRKVWASDAHVTPLLVQGVRYRVVAPANVQVRGNTSFDIEVRSTLILAARCAATVQTAACAEVSRGAL